MDELICFLLWWGSICDLPGSEIFWTITWILIYICIKVLRDSKKSALAEQQKENLKRLQSPHLHGYNVNTWDEVDKLNNK